MQSYLLFDVLNWAVSVSHPLSCDIMLWCTCTFRLFVGKHDTQTPGVKSNSISTGCTVVASIENPRSQLSDCSPLSLHAGWVAEQLRAADQMPAAILQEVQESMATHLCLSRS